MGGRTNPPYYLTAYGLAVMQGFKGTVEEWLESLKGIQGDKGDKIELRYLDDEIKWRWIPNDEAPESATDDEYTWQTLVSLPDIRGKIIEETINSIETNASEAEAAANSATQAAILAEKKANSIGSGVFMVECGVAKLGEIVIAVGDGRWVWCRGPGGNLPLAKIDDTGALFAGVTSPVDGVVMGYSVDASDKWNVTTTISKKVEVIDANSTSNQVPTAHAVYAALQGLEQKIHDNDSDNNTELLVESVNGKTGAVALSAADVGARPADWMPTAQDVGALPRTYTPPDQTAAQVGADPAGTAASAVSAHNTSTATHEDIRLLIEGLNARMNALANSTDEDLDQMAELVAYIKSNKDLIDGITTSKVSVTDIVNNLTTNVSNKPLSAAQGVALKTLIDGLTTGKLDASKLPEAVNSALAQAKADGTFDGKDGTPGTNGVSPKVSVTDFSGGHRITITDAAGTKMVDVMDGDPGNDGRGIKAIARTSGTGAAGTTDTYTITYTDNSTTTFGVYNGKDGRDGEAGKDGRDGKTPEKGVDYWTDGDREAIIQQVIAALGTPVFGRVDGDNNIVLTGELADGTYTLKYENADGVMTGIGSIMIGGPSYTNWIPKSVGVDGAIYNGKGYKEDTRWSLSGGGDVSATGVTVSGYIPVKTGDVIRIKNITMNKNGSNSNACAISYFWSRSNTDGSSANAADIEKYFKGTFGSDGNLTQFEITAETHPTFIRLNTGYIGPDSILTINEPIE